MNAPSESLLESTSESSRDSAQWTDKKQDLDFLLLPSIATSVDVAVLRGTRMPQSSSTTLGPASISSPPLLSTIANRKLKAGTLNHNESVSLSSTHSLLYNQSVVRVDDVQTAEKDVEIHYTEAEKNGRDSEEDDKDEELLQQMRKVLSVMDTAFRGSGEPEDDFIPALKSPNSSFDERGRDNFKNHTPESTIEDGPYINVTGIPNTRDRTRLNRTRIGSIDMHESEPRTANDVVSKATDDSVSVSKFLNKIYQLLHAHQEEFLQGSMVLALTPCEMIKLTDVIRNKFAALSKIADMRHNAPVDYLKHCLTINTNVNRINTIGTKESNGIKISATGVGMDIDASIPDGKATTLLNTMLAQLPRLIVIKDRVDVDVANKIRNSANDENDAVIAQDDIIYDMDAGEHNRANLVSSITLRKHRNLQYDCRKSIDISLFCCLKRLELIDISLPENGLNGIQSLKKSLTSLVVINVKMFSIKQLLMPGANVSNESITSGQSVDRQYKSSWKLKTFVCSRCNIKFLDESMELLSSVHYLDLSQNCLQSLKHIEHCICLTHLDISFNNFSDCRNIYEHVGNISTLVLQRNGITSTAGLDKLYSIRILDLSGNLISRMSEVQDVCTAPCLESLWLHGNPITMLRDYRISTISLVNEPQNFELDGRKSDEWEVLMATTISDGRDTRTKPHESSNEGTISHEPDATGSSSIPSSIQDKVKDVQCPRKGWLKRLNAYLRHTLITKSALAAPYNTYKGLNPIDLNHEDMQNLDQGFICNYIVYNDYLSKDSDVDNEILSETQSLNVVKCLENEKGSTEGLNYENIVDAMPLTNSNEITIRDDALEHSSPPRFHGSIIQNARRSFTLTASAVVGSISSDTDHSNTLVTKSDKSENLEILSIFGDQASDDEFDLGSSDDSEDSDDGDADG